MLRLLPLCLLTICSYTLSSFAHAADQEPVQADVVLAYDGPWLFWLASSPPNPWPLTELPASSGEAVSLLGNDAAGSPHPPDAKSSTAPADTDRVAQLSRDPDSAVDPLQWWDGFYAPFSVWSPTEWDGYFGRWTKSRKRRRRSGKHFSRTALVYWPSDSSASSEHPPTAYFAQSFEIKDASKVVSIEVAARYKAGVQLFINGEAVVRDRLQSQPTHNTTGVIPEPPAPWIENTVPGTERWEKTWFRVPPSVLRDGTNVLSAAVYRAEESAGPSTYFDAEVRVHTEFGWSKIPYLHGVTGEAVTISWETTSPSAANLIVKAQSGAVVFKTQKSKAERFQEVRVEGLKPNQSYSYEVLPTSTFAGKTPEPFRAGFRTAPTPNDSFSFLLYGDSRWGRVVHRALANQMVDDAKKHDISLVVHTGDMVSVGYDWHLWQERFFAPAAPLLANVPMYPAPGNHEKNAKLYYDYFDLPGNEAWYHFRHGIADFFALNTNVSFSPDSEQYKWFVDKLKTVNGRWKIVFMHHPPFSCANDRKPGARLVVRDLVPLFEQYGVDLVLLGHDHVYGRSGDINGVHYLISGGGGSALYSSTVDDKMVRCDKRYNYVRLHVDGSQIRWLAYDENAELIEEYAID